MEKIDSVIFDLDGTLWDTCPTCAVAWNNVLRRREIKFREITADDVRRVTGKPHDQCIREIFVGVSEPQIQYLIEDTIDEDNTMVEKLGGYLYEGVAVGLRVLADKLPLFIVSNCQAGYIEIFLKFSGFGNFIKDFECWGKTGKSKADNLANVIRRNQLKNPVFVGDADSDRIAARACGVPFYFVEYGFGKVTDYKASFSNFNSLTDHLVHLRRA